MSTALDSILGVPDFRARFDRLRRRIQEAPEKVVPWIGAGMSKPFGLPLWSEFLSIAAEQLSGDEKVAFEKLRNLDNVDLALIAEFLHSRLRGRLRGEVIEQFNKSLRWSPKECLVPWLGVKAVVTTNYDRILDSLLPWLTPVSAAAASGDFRDLRCLIKLHGRVEDPDSVVLTRSQYVRAYTDRFWTWLEQFSYSNTFLFLGCSLAGDDFLEVLKPEGVEAAPRHFAIIPTRSDEESRWRSDLLSRSYGIETISYDPNKHGHGVVRDLLDALVPSLKQATRRVQGISNEAELELAWENYQRAAHKTADRKEKVEYLIALLNTGQPNPTLSGVRREIFEALVEFCADEGAWSALLEAAKGSEEDTSRLLQLRERLRPLFDESTQSLTESSDPRVRKYYQAFRSGNHKEASKWLDVLKKRSGADVDRIEVLVLQNALFNGVADSRALENFKKELSSNGQYLYLDYGLGLYYMWRREFGRAHSSFNAARSPWPRGKSAFISWQEAICEILSGDLMTARVKLEAVAVGAFLPLGPAGDLIRRSGGSELSFDPRRATSKELYCLVWFLRSLTARAMKLSDEASERHEATLRLLESIQDDDLLLSWLLYADSALKGQRSEALRIELEHRTRRSPGIGLILEAVAACIREISKDAGDRYSESIAAAVGTTASTTEEEVS